MAKAIGKAIRALRKERELTLEQLALEIGSDASNLSRIERGAQQPTQEILHALSLALKTSISALYAIAEGAATIVTASGEHVPLDDMDFSDEAIQLRRHFRKLTPRNRQLVLEMVRLIGRMQDTTRD